MFSDETQAVGRRSDTLLVFISCLFLSLFCWFVLSPTIGWDDANITLNYAENIANGSGYVYYVGGERVEGSTSALWTAICAAGYLISDNPEYLLAALSFVFAFAAVTFAVQITQVIFRLTDVREDRAVPLVIAFFACLPSFFATTVWSLMETSLFCFVVAGFLRTAIRMIEVSGAGRSSELRLTGGLAFFAVLMVLTRPEGILLVIGACLVLVGLNFIWPRLHLTRVALVVGAIATLALALLTSARLLYFGYPFPNTYYAKVSTDRVSEIKMGIDYVVTYLKGPENAALILLGVFAVGIVWRARMRWGLLETSLLLASFFCGVLLTYTVLGGDIFPGHRYFLVLTTALIPAAALTTGKLLEWGGRRTRALVILTLLVASLVSLTVFAAQNRDPGYMDLAFHHRLSENAREIGARFNTLPEKPSIAVFIAGGIAMTYDGPIHDMNGLNWVAMAHSDRQLSDQYGVFSKSVFFKALPEIVSPHLNACRNATWTETKFAEDMLHGLFQDPMFLELYELDCWNELSFFRLKSFPAFSES